MRIYLEKTTVETDKIKKLHNKRKKLRAGNKDIILYYTIEFADDSFMEITKQEYKMLKKYLEKEK